MTRAGNLWRRHADPIATLLGIVALGVAVVSGLQGMGLPWVLGLVVAGVLMAVVAAILSTALKNERLVWMAGPGFIWLFVAWPVLDQVSGVLGPTDTSLDMGAVCRGEADAVRFFKPVDIAFEPDKAVWQVTQSGLRSYERRFTREALVPIVEPGGATCGWVWLYEVEGLQEAPDEAKPPDALAQLRRELSTHNGWLKRIDLADPEAMTADLGLQPPVRAFTVIFDPMVERGWRFGMLGLLLFGMTATAVYFGVPKPKPWEAP